MTLRVLTVCLALVATVAAQTTPSPEAQLQSAIHRETVLGDLKGAISEYKRVIAAAGGNRQLAAQALLRLAAAHEKLGTGDDQAIYRQIVSDYADQKSAALVARERLKQPQASATQAERVIWTGNDVPNGAVISPDGEFLVYRKGRERAAVLRNIATRAESVFIKDEIIAPRSAAGRQVGGTAVGGAFSQDGRYYAYDWRVQNADEVYDELRVVEVQTSGLPVPRVVFTARDTSGYGIRPTGWTRDGRRIAVVIGRLADQTRRVGFVDVNTGALTVLKTLEWRGTTQLAPSPDGAYLAFDMPVNEKATQRDVFVLAANGSRQTSVVVNPSNDEVVGWSPDGNHLLFRSDRGGQPSLWSQPMKNGRPQGAAQILKPAIGRTRILGLAKSGDLFHLARLNDQAIYTASVDRLTGALKGQPAPITTPWLTNWMPSFSRDGKSLFYLSSAEGDVMISFLDMSAGTTRTLPVGLNVLSQDWAPDGRWMVAGAADIEGRLGLYRIDVATGDVAPIVIPPASIRYVRPQVSADGKSIYYFKRDFPNGQTIALMTRDLATGVDKQLYEGTSTMAFHGEVSPDGTRLGALRVNQAQQITLSVINLGDGSEKQLLSLEPPASLLANPVVEWTSDSAAVVIRKELGENRGTELWRISIADSKAVKLDTGVPNYTGAQIGMNADATQIAFIAGEPERREIRVLQGIMPTAMKAGKSASK